MKRALLTGITGQDGSYLAEFLPARGYEVHGIIRRASAFNTDRIDHLYRDPHDPEARRFLHYGDVSEGTSLSRLLERVRPDEIYHLGAQSHVKVSFEQPEYTADVVATGTLRLLRRSGTIGTAPAWRSSSIRPGLRRCTGPPPRPRTRPRRSTPAARMRPPKRPPIGSRRTTETRNVSRGLHPYQPRYRAQHHRRRPPDAGPDLLFLGSSCIYPREAPQPMKEGHLLTGPLEPTNQAYAVAKIAGVELCRSYHRQYGSPFISCMPTNLYGPGDNFHLETSHVLPALIRKFHEGKVSGAEQVVVWGSGAPRREFLHVDDLADACVFLMRNYDDPEIINVGVGEDIPIKELAELIADVVGYEGEIVFDTSKPDGTPRKLLDVSRLNALGWKPSIGLREGLEGTYRWYLEHESVVLST